MGVFAVIAVAALISGAAALRMLPPPDISWLLLSAGRLLDGGRYGVDVLEVNPPLIAWVYSIPVLLSRLSGIPAYTLLMLITLFLAVASLAAVYVLLGTDRREAAALTVALGAGILLLPAGDFAQREHLAAISCAPWLALALRRARNMPPGRGATASVAVLGAVGFLLKPYFLLGWAAVELYLARHRGFRLLLRLENIVLAAAGVTYIACVALIAPGYIALARMLGPAYATYLSSGASDAAMLGLWLGGMGLFLLWRIRVVSAAGVFGAATIGFLLAGIVQLKWWSYHFLPAAVFGIAALAALAYTALGRLPARVASRGRKTTTVLAALAIVVIAARPLDVAGRPEHPDHLADASVLPLREWLRGNAPDADVMLFSTNINSAFPAIPLSGSRWTSRLPSLWPLAAAYGDAFVAREPLQVRPPATRNDLELWIEETVYADMVAGRPEILIVRRYEPARRDHGGSGRFDYMAYFSAVPRLRAILDAYIPVAAVGFYQVYRRNVS